MDIKILLAYHKSGYLVNEYGYIPMCREETWADGNSAPLLYSVPLEGKSFNEMTAVYWAWKNYDKIGNPEYIGLCHYRRIFIFDRKLPRPKNTWFKSSRVFRFADYKSVLPYINVGDAEKILECCDILTASKYNANKNLAAGAARYENCEDRFYAIGDFNPDLYNLMEEFVLDARPDFLPEVQALRDKAGHYLCNMFVMKKENFFKYCEFIFPILFKLAEANAEETRKKERRAVGFLAEFLTSMFVSHCERAEGKKVKELDVAFIEYTEDFELKAGVTDALLYVLLVFVVAFTFGKKGRGRMKKEKERLVAAAENSRLSIPARCALFLPRVFARFLAKASRAFDF